MDGNELLPTLNLFTLVAVFLAIVISFAIYWSKRKNRPPKDGGPPTEDGSV
ncbi:hypothetical protein [Polymorphobacter sp.]|uniref:hypothetical protein n=1 Tax=Polymorphobacter sp. TaxID=1909290 RepID=UPI003F6ED09E